MPRAKRRSFAIDWRQVDVPFWTLVILLVAATLLGGGSRDDILSLPILRPLAVLCLGIGVWTVSREHLSRGHATFIWFGALLALAALHLVPLPPAVWTALPGREIPAQAASAAGIPQPWLPLALVPWRAWNAFYSLLVPLAALVLAVQISPDRRRQLVYLILGLTLLSVGVAIGQVVTGYSHGLYFYRITNFGAPTGLFANRNHFALLMCCAFPLLASIAPAGRNQDKNAFPVLLGILLMGLALMMLILLTGSRAGLALTPVAIALAAFVLDPQPRSRRKPRDRRLLIALAAGATLLMVGAAVYMSKATAFQRLMETGSDERRLSSWGPIVGMALKYFPVGAGMGSFSDVYRIDEPRELLGTSYLNHVHNDWLEWIFDLGLPGAILLTAAVILWTIHAKRLILSRREASFGGRVARAAAVVILLTALASLLDYPARVPAIACLLAVAAAFITEAPEPAAMIRHKRGRP